MLSNKGIKCADQTVLLRGLVYTFVVRKARNFLHVAFGPIYTIILTFSKQSLNNPLAFVTVHSLMNDTNVIDSCQAHLPVQYASTIKLIRKK